MGYFTWYGQPIWCLAKNQTVVAISTAEAEYRTMTKVMQRSIFEQTIATTFENTTAIVMENTIFPPITII